MPSSVELDSLQPCFDDNNRANSHTSEDPLLGQDLPTLKPASESSPAYISDTSVSSSTEPGYQKVANDDNGSSPPLPMFNPIWLSKTCLGGFIVALVLIGIALGLVYHLAETDNGFILIFNDRYSWAYGPTAGEFLRLPRY